MSARGHSRLLSLPVLQQAYRAFLHAIPIPIIVHRHEELQIAQGQPETGTALKASGATITTQSAGEAEWRQAERVWVCIKGVLLAQEGDEGSEHQQHHQDSEEYHEGAVVGSAQVHFIAHPYRDLLRIALYGLLLGGVLILEGYMCRILTGISIEVFIRVVVHELHSHHDLAERLVLLALYAYIVCKKDSAAVLLQYQFSSLEQRRLLPQRSVIAFSFDIQECGPARGISPHADCEDELVVVDLLRLVVEVAVIAVHPDRSPSSRQLPCCQLAPLPYEVCWALTTPTQALPAIQTAAGFCEGAGQAGQDQGQDQKGLPAVGIKYIVRQHYYQRIARHLKAKLSPHELEQSTGEVQRNTAWCFLMGWIGITWYLGLYYFKKQNIQNYNHEPLHMALPDRPLFSLFNRLLAYLSIPITNNTLSMILQKYHFLHLQINFEASFLTEVHLSD